MWDDFVRGSNEKNWDLFSKYMPKENATEEVRKNVEGQWSTNEVLTTFTEKQEFVDILRRNDCVVVVWKQWSTKVEGDFLALLYLQSQDGEVRQLEYINLPALLVYDSVFCVTRRLNSSLFALLAP